MEEPIVLDDFLDVALAWEVRALIEGLTSELKPHHFSFAGAVWTKPGIWELEPGEAQCPPELATKLETVEGLVASAVGTKARAAVKVQRNVGGAFPCHYDNPGPPNTRVTTAILYLTDGGPGEGGCLRLEPFLRPASVVRPRHNRLVAFGSDRCLHSVSRWRSNRPRHAVSFWFEGPVDEKTTLTKADLAFPNWDAAADFFINSPLQRCVSRAVYAEEYSETLDDCGFEPAAAATMRGHHEAAVVAIEKALRPLILELRLRKAALPPPTLVD